MSLGIESNAKQELGS